MRPQILVGAVIGLVIVAGWVFAPALRSSASKSAQAALEQSELARRAVNQYDPTLTRLERRLGDARSQLNALITANDAFFADALRIAKGATESGADVPGVAHVEGAIQYLHAGRALAESQKLRLEADVRQARLLALALEWKADQGDADYYTGLDFSGSLETLVQDRASLVDLERAAAVEAKDLKTAIAFCVQQLEQVRSELARRHEELRRLQEAGFTAGNDEEFNRYRDSYLALSADVRALQAREVRYRHIEGPAPGDSAPFETETLAGPLPGLEELQRRLAAAEERATRLADGLKRIDERAVFVQAAEQQAKDEEARFQEQLGTGESELEAAQKTLGEAAATAFRQEDAAIRAAQAASAAFSRSQRAIDNVMSEARNTKRDKDPQSQNERLELITSDRFAIHFGKSAEAGARMLEGRIHAQRYLAIRQIVDALDQVSDMTGRQAQTEQLLEIAEGARAAGVQALNTARDAFQTLAERSPEEVKWIPQTSLAVTHYLLSQVDPTDSDLHFSAAVESINSAVADREHSPYLKHAVAFRDLLKKLNPAAFGEVEPAEGEEAFEDEF